MENRDVIMCVDDEPQVLESLMRDLTPRYGKDNDIDICESAEEALELRESLHSKGKRILYIVDQRMPGVKGIDFLEQIEKDAGKILLTAYADTEVAIRGINNRCIDFYIMKPYGDELFKSIDHLLLANQRGIFVSLARTPQEREKALKTQNTVFSEDHLGLPYEKGIKIIGDSAYTKKTDIYVAVSNRDMIGTTSISRKDNEFAQQFGTKFGLPIEDFYDISNILEIDDNLVQVRNATVLPEYQNRRIAPMIWGQVYRDLTQVTPESKFILILSASEIRDAKTAKAVFEKIKRSDLFDKGNTITLREPNSLSDEQISEREIQDAVLPRLLKMYSKMNFKFIGEPVYYKNYKMFDYPMLLKLDETAEPYKTWFTSKRI